MTAENEIQQQKQGKPNWEALIAAKRLSNLAKIPLEWRLTPSFLEGVDETARISVLDVPRKSGILSAAELDITEKYSACQLVKEMVEGRFKSEDVVRAFCKRAAIAQQLVNCLTEIMFDEAVERAKQADAYLANNGKPMGPFHGLPISLKDSFNVKGTHTTIGYVSYLQHPPASQNSALVEIILKLGGIPFVKTNLPQSMMSADSENHVFGRTLNPNRLCLTAGGSTGGEGSLLKMRGSILGVGTDIGGSVRIPSLCNGILGFKPSAGRIPFAGKVPPGRIGSPGSILPVIGPEGHYVSDLELFLKGVIDSQPWLLDGNVINIPWRKAADKELKFGVILEDSKVPLHPPMLKTMEAVKKGLSRAGIKLVDLTDKVPSLYDTSILAWKYFLLDPKKTPIAIMKAGDEPFVKSILSITYPELQDWQASLDELWDMNVERCGVMRRYHDLVVENDLDGILLPTYQSSAVIHDAYGIVPYTVLANLLDYPAASLPYLKASKEEDKAFIRAGVTYRPEYNPDDIEGAPCGFQVLGRPLEDEELLKAVALIESVLSLET